MGISRQEKLILFLNLAPGDVDPFLESHRQETLIIFLNLTPGDVDPLIVNRNWCTLFCSYALPTKPDFHIFKFLPTKTKFSEPSRYFRRIHSFSIYLPSWN